MATKLGEIQINVMGVPVTVRGAIYYPPEPETDIDPRESAFAEWGSVYADNADLSPQFEYSDNADRLREALIQSQEG